MTTTTDITSLPMRVAPGDSGGASPAGVRVLRLVGLFRLLVAAALILAALWFQNPPVMGQQYPMLFQLTGLVYLTLAAAFFAFQRGGRMPHPNVLRLQLAVDIGAITILLHASGGVGSGIGGLLVVYVGCAALTMTNRDAYVAAAVSSLAILGEQVLSVLTGHTETTDFIGAGVLGAIIFMIAAAVVPLARRLSESEALARQRGIDLANMAQLNEYIIQNLRESIVVVDENDRIRLINQSAAEHLGAGRAGRGLPLSALSRELARLLTAWRAGGGGTPPSFVAADGSTEFNTYIAPLGGREDGPALIFLEDASHLAAKVQQSKLAALGRLSASIAHEIRNPVGALSHAGQLLAESPLAGGPERRLVDIIDTNSRRVSEIVDNVLQLSRREPTDPERILLDDWLPEFREEFAATREIEPALLALAGDPGVEVHMDRGHLRQVLWNLVENALVYGRNADGGADIEISYGRMPGNQRPYLTVADRGPGVSDEFRDQLFEPFATARAGGTGLGLFISRELCECNQAALIYEPRRHGGSRFRIVFSDPARWSLAT